MVGAVVKLDDAVLSPGIARSHSALDGGSAIRSLWCLGWLRLCLLLRLCLRLAHQDALPSRDFELGQGLVEASAASSLLGKQASSGHIPGGNGGSRGNGGSSVVADHNDSQSARSLRVLFIV